MNKQEITALLLLTIGLASCGEESTREQVQPESYVLVWSDEFNGAEGESPDPTRWTFDIGTGPNFDGYGNAQLEFTTDLPSNVRLDGQGNLAIIAQRVDPADREGFLGREFTAGRITTKGKFATQFGRIEARMKLPAGKGLWPAFWMLGDTFPEVPWPEPGEIDIMEFRGQDEKTVLGTIHGPGFCGSPADCGTGPIGGTFRFDGVLGFDDQFHVFAIEWDEERIAWFVDDQVYLSLNTSDVANVGGQWVFDQPFFLLLNLAVGGSFVIESPDASTPFPSSFLIDYVRIFQRLRGSTEPPEVVDVDEGPKPLPTPSSITVNPRDIFFGVGGSQLLDVRDEVGNVVSNGVQWTSGNESIVKVGSSGVVYGIQVGTTTVAASINGASQIIDITVSSTVAPPNRIQLPMAVDDFYPGRSSFGAVVGQAEGGPPLHTEDALCPMRADNAVGQCHRITWDGRDSQGGTSPAFTGDFWTIGGSFDNLQSRLIQSGATALTFVAWGSEGGEVLTFGAGLAANDGGSDTITFTLSATPQTYTVALVQLLSYNAVFSPFTWSATNGGNPNGFIVYIDDIQWVTP